jgi:hypothetical protein
MSLSPLAPVTDYQSMLNRVSWFTTATGLAAVWLLRASVPTLDDALRQVDTALALGGASSTTPAGYLLPALAVGIATRVFRLHARLSDWLEIRECFDVEVILAELADRTGVDLAGVSQERLRAERHHLMRTAFYRFVSGSEPVVDRSLIHQALDAWSWFWVLLEATAVSTVASFGLIACSAYQAGFQLLGAALAVAATGLPALRNQCRRYAVAQVRAIVDDPERAAAVRAAFNELTGQRHPRRAAA